MGYTHYWEGTVPAASENIVAAISYILTKVQMGDNAIKLAGWHGTGFPIFDEAKIEFNGLGDDSYESFTVKYGESISFNCCKTAQKPYDLAVVAVLEALRIESKGIFTWSSDGDDDDTADGRALAAAAFASFA